jgi:molybdopterin converting factor small subunit
MLKINLHATYRLITGVKVVEQPPADGMTIRTALENLVELYPRLRMELLDEDGRPHQHVHVFLNRKDITHHQDWLEIGLGGDDSLDLFPPIGGG